MNGVVIEGFEDALAQYNQWEAESIARQAQGPDYDTIVSGVISCDKDKLIDEVSLAKLKNDVAYYNKGTFKSNSRNAFFYFRNIANDCGLSPSAKCIKYELLSKLPDLIYDFLTPQVEDDDEDEYEELLDACDFHDGDNFLDLHARLYLILKKGEDSEEYERLHDYQDPLTIKALYPEVEIREVFLDELSLELAHEVIKEDVAARKIQVAWRECRYNPEYKMCEKVQLNNLELDTGLVL